jgi:hypothetical protein
MTLGSKPPMSNADVLPEPQWGWAQPEAQEAHKEDVWRKNQPQPFSRQAEYFPSNKDNLSSLFLRRFCLSAAG